MIPRIFKSDLLYTSAGEPIRDGMLAVDEKQNIVAVGKDLNYGDVPVENFEGALCPGFINTHCHIELSHLKEKVQEKTGLDGFIKELQLVREAEDDEIRKAIQDADSMMRNAGIVACGDISNGTSSFELKTKSSIYYHTFVELFGFDPEKADQTFQRGLQLSHEAKNLALDSSIVPHSPYSVSEKLFNLIASQENNSPICIHNQESESENELYQNGSGKLAEMLIKFGNNLESFQYRGQNSLPSYLNLLPKDKPLLLVHNTYTSAEDLERAEEISDQLFWCFCPKANLYIENRLPDFTQFLATNATCTLGTDSLASNDTLSVWEEIKTIQAHCPSIDLNTLIKWGTINGAKFLGLDKIHGSFEVGKRATINWLKPVNNSNELTQQRIL